MAWISPRRTERFTSCRARTPGKDLPMPRISKMWSVMSHPSQHGSRGAGRQEPAPRDVRVSGQVLLGVVAAVDQHFLVVVLVDDHRVQQLGRYDLVAVVVVGGVVHVRLPAL